MTETETTWMGQTLESLPRKELINALEYCAEQIENLRQDRDKWRESADPLKYLMRNKHD